ncbi:MAG: sensor histidine kinase [Elusimicrobia bacterium]|nr:sensor histidine kinase [Elusimicrobiota bacterium]
MANGERERSLQDADLAFFGKVAASISHELNNTASIIEQAAGLLEDLSADGGPPLERSRAREIAERIGKQARREGGIIKRLNSFAHSVDEPEREIELGEAAQAVAALALRMAQGRKVALEARPGAGRIVIRRSPFGVLQALYLSVEEAVAASPQGSTVTLSAEGAGAAAVVVEGGCGGQGPAPGDASFPSIEALMGRLGGRLSVSTRDGRLSMRLTFGS